MKSTVDNYGEKNTINNMLYIYIYMVHIYHKKHILSNVGNVDSEVITLCYHTARPSADKVAVSTEIQ